MLVVLAAAFLALFAYSAAQGHLGRLLLIVGGTCLALVVVAARRPPR